MSDEILLLGDAGGTHVRLALAHLGPAGSGAGGIRLSPIWKRRGADYPTFEAAVEDYLAGLGAERPKLAGAAFGFAGPVSDGRVELLHRNWTVDRRVLADRLGTPRVVVVNDFFAMARSAPELGAGEVVEFWAGQPDPEGSIAVGGPGTGFGVGVLRRARDGWVVMAGEGGHQTFSPQTELDWKVTQILRARGVYVSNEVISSGSGFEDTRAALAEALGVAERNLSQAEVIEAAEKGDAFAVEFCRIRARTVMTAMGDMALAANAAGGVYLAGGVTQRLIPWLGEQGAKDCFFQRGPRFELMSRIPIRIITSETAPLLGATHLWQDERERGWL